MTPEETLRALLERVDAARPMVVVRWVDEPRIVPEHASGFTVGHRTYITVMAQIDGAIDQHRIEDLTLRQVKQVASSYPLRVLYRSDNQSK